MQIVTGSYPSYQNTFPIIIAHPFQIFCSSSVPSYKVSKCVIRWLGTDQFMQIFFGGVYYSNKLKVHEKVL